MFLDFGWLIFRYPLSCFYSLQNVVMTCTLFQLFPEKKVSDDQICAAAVAAVLGDQKTGSRRGIDFGNDPFSSETGIRFNHRLSRTVDLVNILLIHSLKSFNLLSLLTL